jgi:predicted DNA-binding antitoxin AbrB/MazE fold protein
MITIRELKNNSFIAFLLVLIIVVGILSYQNARDYHQLKGVFELEKKELESELNIVIKNYEDATYNNDNLSLKIRDKLQEIIKLKDTINDLTDTDYGLFRFYRKRISHLSKQNKVLFNHIDSLKTVNNQLLTKNDSVKKVLVQKESQNTRLKEKIAIAEIIEISAIKVKAMKKRRNGKHTSTSRSSRTDAFKIEFDLLENNIVSSGFKSIYIQIVNNNKVLKPAKKVKLKNKERILCNDIMKANYNNKSLSVISFIDVNRDIINKGSYKINIFVEGHYISNTIIELK